MANDIPAPDVDGKTAKLTLDAETMAVIKRWLKIIGISDLLVLLGLITSFFLWLPGVAADKALAIANADADVKPNIRGFINQSKATADATAKEFIKQIEEKRLELNKAKTERERQFAEYVDAQLGEYKAKTAELKGNVDAILGVSQEKVNTAATALREVAKGIDAAKVLKGQEDLESKIRSLESELAVRPVLPIGSIIAWHKNAKGIVSRTPPEGWVECSKDVKLPDGAKITEIPILNVGLGYNDDPIRGRFLRGGTESGHLQDDAFAKHSHPPLSGAQFRERVETPKPEDGTAGEQFAAGKNGFPNSDRTGPEGIDETRPKNMSVVWIMRVK